MDDIEIKVDTVESKLENVDDLLPDEIRSVKNQPSITPIKKEQPI